VGGFVRFAVLFLFAHFIPLSLGVCVVLFCPPGRSIYGRVLSFRRGGGGAAAAEEGLHLLTSVLSFFLSFCFFFFLVRFFDFMVEESSGGICVFGSVRRTRGFALRFARSGGFRSSRDRGEWIPIRGSCS
jgi:hypothetical protein